jgi:hypothetical protein
MNYLTEFKRTSATSPTYVQRGWLRGIEDDGTLLVATDQSARSVCRCDVLLPASGASAVLNPGERVLFIPPEDDDGRGCVLGAIGRYTPSRPAPLPDQTYAADARKEVLNLAADEKISLTCGEASITMTAEGAIVIRGAKVVSRSKGLNRIKGASVLIN